MSHFKAFFDADRYIVVGLLLITLMTISTFKIDWTGDFWEHSAVVRELSTHPLHPKHPLLYSEKEHPFYSPYLLIVGISAKLFDVSSIQALSFFGILNLLFLLISLYLFSNTFFKKHGNIISFYSLILIIFFWSYDSAWFWSGFFHFRVLPYVLPYPSFFAGAMTFLIFCLYNKLLIRGDAYLFVIIPVLLSIVVLSHITTAIFTIIGVFAISVSNEKRNLFRFRARLLKMIILPAILVVCAISISLLWPYFSLWQLIRTNNTEFHRMSITFYSNLQHKLFPFAITLPILLYRIKRSKTDVLVLMFLGGTAVYIYGFLTSNYGFGRIISYIGIVNQIALAAFLAEMESQVRQKKLKYSIPLILVLLLTVAMNLNSSRTFETMLLNGNQSYKDYTFLSEHTKQYDIILSDIFTSWRIPTFGGKVVAWRHPIYGIEDHEDRRRDLRRFFGQGVGNSERRRILEKYNVGFVLIDKTRYSNLLKEASFLKSVYEGEKFILYDVN